MHPLNCHPRPKIPICGDDVLDDGEGCEGDDHCTNCQPDGGYLCDDSVPSVCVEACLDEILNFEINCNDENRDPGDGCDENCEVEEGYICNEEGCHIACGDGKVNNGEECDDGGADSDDGCDSAC